MLFKFLQITIKTKKITQLFHKQMHFAMEKELQTVSVYLKTNLALD